MFQQIKEPLAQLESVLSRESGLVLVGQIELLRTVRQLMLMIHGMGQFGEKQDGVQVLDNLRQTRLSLLSLEKALADLDDGGAARAVLIARKDLGQLVLGLKVVLGGINTRLKDLEASTHTLMPGVGTRDKLVHDLAKREGKETSAIQFLFEGMEQLNRRKGRQAGDELLRKIATVVRGHCSDGTSIYQDGAGFTVVGDWQGEGEALSFSEKVSSGIGEVPSGTALKVIIGVALNEKGEVLAKTQAAVEQGGDGPAIFTPDMGSAKEKQRVKHELALKILDDKAFFPAYQEIFPKKALFGQQKRKFEVLWRSKQLSPIHFFASIKEAGRVSQVTAALLPMVIRDFKGRNCELAINITPEELDQEMDGRPFPRFLVESAAAGKLPLTNIVLELVEWNDADTLSESCLRVLSWLKKKGCRLALDDYGVRSSNLVRLMQLCEYRIVPDFIKIDAALVRGLNSYLNKPEQSVRYKYSIIGIRSIVDLVKELRKEAKATIGIVAEYVDNPIIMKHLERQGVTHFQGFYLAKPKPIGELF